MPPLALGSPRLGILYALASVAPTGTKLDTELDEARDAAEASAREEEERSAPVEEIFLPEGASPPTPERTARTAVPPRTYTMPT